MTQINRKQLLLVDLQVQGGLILRVIGYWAAMLITVTTFLITWRMLTGPARPFWTHFDDLWFQYKLPFLGVTLILPLLIYDALRYSNRFAGPVMRFRRAMRELAHGIKPANLQLRGGDFWLELADEFNAVALRMETLNRQLETYRQRYETPLETAVPEDQPATGKLLARIYNPEYAAAEDTAAFGG